MPSKTTTTLAALLFFGSASAALANTNNRNDHQGSVVGRAVSVTMSSGGAGAVNYEQKPSTGEEKAGFGTPQLALAERAPFCRPGKDTTMAWIKLTVPGGNLIHINVEQVTSVMTLKFREPRLSSTLRAGNFRVYRKMSIRSCS